MFYNSNDNLRDDELAKLSKAEMEAVVRRTQSQPFAVVVFVGIVAAVVGAIFVYPWIVLAPAVWFLHNAFRR